MVPSRVLLTGIGILAVICVPAAALPPGLASPLPPPALEAWIDGTAARPPASWLEPQLLGSERQSAGQRLRLAELDLKAAETAGVAGAELEVGRRRLDVLRREVAGSHRAGQVRSAGERARIEGRRLAGLAAAEQAERLQLERAAAALAAAGDPADLARQAAASAAAGRNDAVVAAFLGTAYNPELAARLERYLRLAGENAPLAAAGTALYRARLHDQLLSSLPAKAIVVSVADQHLTAYDHARPLLDTVVTTGRPELPTDVGPMRVLRKDSPWKMHSPWPKGSPYYYPDETVQSVLWFTETGEGLHDAPWRSWFGPGSDRGDGSHGCINLPDPAQSRLFAWAEIGTPVIVYPGDGQPAAVQLAQRSVDALGQPLSGARGA